jgi:hypothetical protein
MKLIQVREGEIYAYKDRGIVVICIQKPTKCIGSRYGYAAHFMDASGSVHAQTMDDELHPATMRQQRDFWRDAYEELANEMEQ